MAPTTRSAGTTCGLEGHDDVGHVCDPCHEEVAGDDEDTIVVLAPGSRDHQQHAQNGPMMLATAAPAHDEGLGVTTRLRLRRVEDEVMEIPVPATAGPSSERHRQTVTVPNAGSGLTSVCAGGKSEKKDKVVRTGGPGKENVPPLLVNGHVLHGIDVHGDSDDGYESDELNLRSSSVTSSRRPATAHGPPPPPLMGISVDVDPVQAGPSSPATGASPRKPVLRKSRTLASLSTHTRSRDGLGSAMLGGIKTRSGKVAGTTTDCDSGMDVDGDDDGFEMTDKEEEEDEGVVVVKTVVEEDEDAKRRKRRRTEAGPSSSGFITASNLQVVAEGGLSLPGPTGNPSSARNRFSSSGMRTRSGTTIMPRTGRPRTGADTPSATSTSSASNNGALAPRLGRPRTLSQSSSHSSLNGVMMHVAAASSSNNGSTGTSTPGRLSRSVSYAYGFSTGDASSQQSSQTGQASERRTLRRSDSSRSSMSLKRKDREMSVCSMISVRSENMSIPPPSNASIASSNFSFYASTQPSSSSSSGFTDPFSNAFGGLGGDARRISPDMDIQIDPAESSVSGNKHTNRVLFPASPSARKAPASPRRSGRKPRTTAHDDVPTSSPGAGRLFASSRACTPTNQTNPDLASDINVTPRRSLRATQRSDREGSFTPTKTPAMYTGDDISPSASQESEQIVTPKISRIVSKLTLEQKLQQAANAQANDDSNEDEGVVVDTRVYNPYKALKSALRCSSAGGDGANAVVGRETEKASVRTYLETGKIDGSDGLPRALYISGAPGTGKTALVTSISNELREQGWSTAFVNCMGMGGGRKEDVWNRIVMAWDMAGKDERAVETGLRTAQASDKRLLILDEVDALLTSTTSTNANNTLRNLFTLPSTFPNTTVRVIAISNSLDLTARRSISSVLAELSPDNLSFSAYGSKDMIDILRSRIISVKTEAEKNGHDVVELDDKAIELVGRKVEASNGDLRMCLNIMVEAISTTEAEWKKKSSSATTPRSNAATLAPCKVTLTHVLKALTSSIAKLKANVPSGSGSTASGGGGGALETKVRSLNVQVKSILLALLVARQRQRLGLRPAHISAQSASYLPTSGSQSNVVYSDRITIDTLLPTYTSILNHASSSIPPVGQTDFMDLVMQAEVIGIITMDENHHHHHHHHSSVSSSSSFMSVTNVSTTSSSSSSSSSSYPNTPTKSLSRRKSTKSGSRAGDRPIDLMVKDEDLVRALHLVIPHQSESTCKSSGAGSGSGGMMDIELRNTWMREETRWVRAMEGKARAAGEVRERASGKGGRLGFDEV